MAQYDYEKTLFTYLDNIKHQNNTRPLNLGGVFGTGGGTGGPPGGFIGQLPQTRVAFDTSEDEIWDYVTVSGVPSGTSLVTNLNRIRYRLKGAERKQAVFSFEGTAVVGSNPIRLYNFTDIRVIKSVHASVTTAPTGDSIIVNVLKDGTTLFSNPSDKPEIAIGDHYASSPFVDVTSWAVNSYLTVDIEQVGSTIAGEYVLVYVVYTEG